MNPDEFVAFMMFAGLSVIVALLARCFTQSFLRAGLTTGLVVSASVQAYLATHGYDWHKDKFALVGVLYPAGVGFAVAGAVHVALHMWHYRRRSSRSTESSSAVGNPRR